MTTILNPLSKEEVKEVLETNTATTGEVCNILKISRQALPRLNITNELTPFRTTPKMSLYSVYDVKEYIIKYKNGQDHTDCMKRLNYFKEELEKNKTQY